MGSGLMFQCGKCGHEYTVCPGAGMMYPEVQRELLKKIAAGKYGEERKRLLAETRYATVNAETVLYVCRHCGCWKEAEDLTLYAPNDPDAIAGKRYGEKTVEEWGYVPGVWSYELQEDYHVLKGYRHRCPKCGRLMHKATEKESESLPCPKCGEVNHFLGMMMWD